MRTITTTGLGKIGWSRFTSALLLALVVGWGLTACGDKSTDAGMSHLGTQDTNGPNDILQTPAKAPTANKPAYEGPYDATFRAWVNDHDEATVVVSGKVEKVINDNAFTLAGRGNDEDLLIVGADKVSGLRTGSPVTVTGSVRKAFNLPEVEDDIKVKFEDTTVLQGFDRDPYIEATQVDAPATPTP